MWCVCTTRAFFFRSYFASRLPCLRFGRITSAAAPASASTPAAAYSHSWNPSPDFAPVCAGVSGVVGVSGSPEEIAKAIKAFRIYARKSPTQGGGYNMDHSSTMLLFDSDGQYAGLIGYQEEHERAMTSLRRLLGG